MKKILALVLGAALAGTTMGGPASAGPDGTSRRTAPGIVARADAAVGQWTVRLQDDGSYVVAWTSPDPLPVTADQPRVLEGTEDLGPALVSLDGRTATLAAPTATPPDLADLDLVLSGRAVDEPPTEPAGPGASRKQLALGPEFGFDPAAEGTYTTETSDYTLDRFSFPGMKKKLEMKGHVVGPAEDELSGDAPLVLFLHGRHQPCYNPSNPDDFSNWPCKGESIPVPSEQGYDYIQQRLASQGYYTVSIAANGINGQDGSLIDGGAAARAELVRRQLDQWTEWAGDGTYSADMSKVVLVGHSRGGEGVNRASEEIGLDAPYRIAGQVLIAPTNFARQTAAYVPTVTMLPYCDGDVSDLQGQQYTDVSRGLAPDDTSLKSTVLMMGANHNFFNTEWTPGLSQAPSFDDWGGRENAVCGTATDQRLTAQQQQSVGLAYVAGAVQLFTGSDETLPMFDGTLGHVASTGDAEVRSTALGAGRDLRIPGRDLSVGTSTADAMVCKGYVGRRSALCGQGVDGYRAPHWAQRRGVPTFSGVQMAWDSSGQEAALALDAPWDLSGASSLDLRTVVDPASGSPQLAVRLTDGSGGTATVTPSAAGQPVALPGRARFGLAKLLAQDLRVPLDEVAGDVDLSQVVSVTLVGQSGTGRVWVLDLAEVPGGPLAAVPAKRLPQIDLGRASQIEGDSGDGVIEVPFAVQGTLTAPATFRVLVDSYPSKVPPVDIELEPGDEGGVVRVPYQPNTLYDLPRRTSFMTAYAVEGAMPADGFGKAVLVDDDPVPTVTVRPVRSTVAEGDRAEVEVQLSKRVGFDWGTAAFFVKGPTGPRLRLGDLRKRWAELRLGASSPASLPLWGQHFALFDSTRGRSLTFSVPVRRDGIHEGVERMTLRVDLRQFDAGRPTASVKVRDPG